MVRVQNCDPIIIVSLVLSRAVIAPISFRQLGNTVIAESIDRFCSGVTVSNSDYIAFLPPAPKRLIRFFKTLFSWLPSQSSFFVVPFLFEREASKNRLHRDIDNIETKKASPHVYLVGRLKGCSSGKHAQ